MVQELPTPDDVVIALMGQSGSGKSSFIDLFKPDPRPHIEHSIDPGTTRVGIYTCRHAAIGKFWLIDTVGFNDQNMSDAQVLREIARFFGDMPLTGIIYMHSIEDLRFPRSAMHNVDLFERLVGNNATRTVLLVSTFWDNVPDSLDRSRAEDNERDMKQTRGFWGNLLDAGAQIDRHYNTLPSAVDIVERVRSLRTVCDGAVWTRMQNELRRNGRLSETHVGREVSRLLDAKEDAFEEERSVIDRNRRRALRAKDEDHLSKIREEVKHEKDLQKLRDERNILQTSRDDLKLECEEMKRKVDGTDLDSQQSRAELIQRKHDAEKRLAELTRRTVSGRQVHRLDGGNRGPRTTGRRLTGGPFMATRRVVR